MIFAFLLLCGCFVLQPYPGTRVQHLRVRNPRNLEEGGISELRSRRRCKETIDFYRHIDGDGVCVSF